MKLAMYKNISTYFALVGTVKGGIHRREIKKETTRKIRGLRLFIVSSELQFRNIFTKYKAVFLYKKYAREEHSIHSASHCTD